MSYPCKVSIFRYLASQVHTFCDLRQLLSIVCLITVSSYAFQFPMVIVMVLAHLFWVQTRDYCHVNCLSVPAVGMATLFLSQNETLIITKWLYYYNMDRQAAFKSQILADRHRRHSSDCQN